MLPNLNFSANCLNLVNDLFGAVQFLTLEPLDFLHVQSFVNKVENDFACIDKSLFFHHGNIVWSGLQQKETQLLYHYVYNTLLPSYSSRLSGKVFHDFFRFNKGIHLYLPLILWAEFLSQCEDISFIIWFSGLDCDSHLKGKSKNLQ